MKDELADLNVPDELPTRDMERLHAYFTRVGTVQLAAHEAIAILHRISKKTGVRRSSVGTMLGLIAELEASNKVGPGLQKRRTETGPRRTR